MAVDAKIVEPVGFFKGLDRSVIETIARVAQVKSYDRDEYIFGEGDEPDWFCALVKGKVKIVRHSPSGRDVIIDIMDPGQIFGEVAVYDGEPYPASAVTSVQSDILRIRRSDFLRLVMENAVIGLKIVEVLARRLRGAAATISSLGSEHVQQRIALLLMKFGDRVGDDSPIKLTRQEVAELTGTTVETAIRVLSRLDKDGITSSERGRIRILDREHLKDIIESA